MDALECRVVGDHDFATLGYQIHVFNDRAVKRECVDERFGVCNRVLDQINIAHRKQECVYLRNNLLGVLDKRVVNGLCRTGSPLLLFRIGLLKIHGPAAHTPQAQNQHHRPQQMQLSLNVYRQWLQCLHGLTQLHPNNASGR